MTITDLLERRAQRIAPHIASPQLLVLPSRFDVHQVPAFEQMIDGMLTPDNHTVVIDAEAVMHADQAGITALLEAADRAERSGVRFEVLPSTTLRIAVELVLEIPDASTVLHGPSLEQAA